MDLDKYTRMPPHDCLRCGHRLDAVSTIEDKFSAPSPGDVTVCINCGLPMIFDDKFKLRRPTQAELDELEFNADYHDTVRAIADLRRQD